MTEASELLSRSLLMKPRSTLGTVGAFLPAWRIVEAPALLAPSQRDLTPNCRNELSGDGGPLGLFLGAAAMLIFTRAIHRPAVTQLTVSGSL